MQIYSAMDLKAGKKAEHNKMGTLTQPIQFLPEKEKDDEWRAWNLDWLEWQGMKQLRRNARRLMKNYKLAKGIIDKADYIVEEDNEMADLIDVLTKVPWSVINIKSSFSFTFNAPITFPFRSDVLTAILPFPDLFCKENSLITVLLPYPFSVAIRISS